MAQTTSFLAAVLVVSLLVAPGSALSWSSITAVLGSLFSTNRYEPGEWPPAFCNEFECPMYEVVPQEHSDYEVRRYDPAVWATSSGIEGGSMFMTLFRYIEGINVEGDKIDMTVPVIKLMSIGPDGEVEADKTMSFFIPPEDTAPTPHDD